MYVQLILAVFLGHIVHYYYYNITIHNTVMNLKRTWTKFEDLYAAGEFTHYYTEYCTQPTSTVNCASFNRNCHCAKIPELSLTIWCGMYKHRGESGYYSQHKLPQCVTWHLEVSFSQMSWPCMGNSGATCDKQLGGRNLKVLSHSKDIRLLSGEKNWWHTIHCNCLLWSKRAIMQLLKWPHNGLYPWPVLV